MTVNSPPLYTKNSDYKLKIVAADTVVYKTIPVFTRNHINVMTKKT